MPTIDADSHIFESAQAWEYIPAKHQAHKPVLVMTERVDETKLGHAGSNVLARPSRWLIAGQAYAALTVGAAGYPPGAQTLDAPDERIAHMDRLGVDLQVIYPTLFFGFIVDSTVTELVLVESYHRWMSEVCGPRRKRMRWIAPISPKNPEASAALLRAAKDGGAVGVMIPSIDLDRHVGHGIYDCIYRKAAELDLAVCVHLGHASAPYRMLRPEGAPNAMYVTAPLVIACEAVIKMKLAEKYPTLRWGFIEGSASWVPFLAYRAVTEYGKMPTWRERAVTLLAKNNIYVSCEAYEDFAHIVPFSGDDRLMLGTDYGHTDPGVELDGFRALLSRMDLDAALKAKLTDTNAARFYGLA
jgi:predicted TIM-barrel fold metal-dependent hydrolase